MKVLVATARTQGTRPDDYHRCIEGELVRIGEACATDRVELAAPAAGWPTGAVVERRLDALIVRALPEPVA